ncbi:MAG TPA: UDP-N-acetylmuramoyl-L-alanine--D-glutamate ligase [Actinomycetes bacterium]|nr:UDP-N-acetylmuramoyl-L-alanine--D-glutamate ligase [Actinomycetes bacterium]
MSGRLTGPGQELPWPSRHVVVTGLGVSGKAVAIALAGLGVADLQVVDAGTSERHQQAAAALREVGVRVSLGEAASRELPAGTDLVITSPGWRPDQPLLRAAAGRGVPVWGDVELAWRLRPAGQQWLALTGTNGKTTTVRMLEAMLLADGRRALAAGNVGTSLVATVLEPTPYDVLAVELSSFELHWAHTLAPLAGAVLNLAPDHIDWHGSMDAYGAAKGKLLRWAQAAAVYNVEDAATEALLPRTGADGARAVGFTRGVPGAGMLGVEQGVLLDRAFGPSASEPVELAAVADITPAAPHNVANALAAAALARAAGVGADAVRDGLRSFRPGAHRIAHVATIDGVGFVDDSKATNPHAAAASLAAYDSVVWIAGGLAKGATFDDLVARAGTALRAVVLLGRDRDVIRAALARHAPDVPVVEVTRTDTGAMDDVVRLAADRARPGDTVLLAPACASMDMFISYAHRGDLFAEATHRLESERLAP